MAAEKNQLSALVVRLQHGDGKAFEEIYNLTREPAYFTALKILKNNIDDAEDVLQESYVQMLEKIGTLENPETFSSWFNRIVANRSKNFLRDSHPEKYTDAYFTDEEGEENSAFDFIEDDNEDFIPESAVENTELQTAVMDMIDSLSDDKRTAVILYYYDNMTTREIAESLGVNENTVKSRLVQAKKDLAKAVTDYEKKHGRLLGVAPMPLVVWALKSAAAGAAASSAASGAAAATLTAVTAGSAAAGTAAAGAAGAAAGTGIVTKIIAGIVAAAIVGGGAAAGTKAVSERRKRNQAEKESTSVTVTLPDSSGDKAYKTIKKPKEDKIYIIPKENKKVDTEVETVDFGYGVKGYLTRYTVKTDGGTETREYINLNRSGFNASYSDLIPLAEENAGKYSQQADTILSGINNERSSYSQLSRSEKLSEQAGVRAAEIALSGVTLNVRPDGSSYKTVFERNGYTSGTRREIIISDCDSPGQVLSRLKNDDNLKLISNPLVTEIGIGAANDPESGRDVYVIHLYSPLGGDDGEDLSKQENGLKIYNILEGVWGNAFDNSGDLVEFIENTPILKDINRIDIPVDGLFMFITEKLQELSDSVSG